VGASGSVGTYIIQLGALLGLIVIGTASPRNADYVKSLGATYVLDHNSPDVLANIKQITGDNLAFAYDTIGPSTADQCLKALSTTRSSHLAFIAGKPTLSAPKNVTYHDVFLGGAATTPEGRESLSNAVTELESLFADKKIQTNKVEVLKGLESVKQGFELLSSGKVSGKKVVITVP